MKKLSQISSHNFFYTSVYKCPVLSPFVSFRAIFSVLDMMKVDMANFAVSSIRPHLMQQSVEYERKQFQELLEKQPSMFQILWCLFVVCVFHFSCCSLLPNDSFKTKRKFSMRIVLIWRQKHRMSGLENLVDKQENCKWETRQEFKRLRKSFFFCLFDIFLGRSRGIWRFPG